MKRKLLAALFVCSLLLNVTVFATLAWHRWLRPSLASSSTVDATVPKEPLPLVREQIATGKREIARKRIEIFDILATDAENSTRLQKAVEELAQIVAERERLGVERVRQFVLSLPAERRQAILETWKRRLEYSKGKAWGPRFEEKMRGFDPK